ncbi:hypothetical protein OCU04_010693 [Sclerotinia nivalis]|uniref:Uncharacterized protein n=1 Tax=Sclerotinia nivalis TaxID=352851 RepID=A0A9X0DGX5_9HELO|nr:hypothetical protein OCU04_010693 [Sclerotinia nivalis]
MESSSKNHYSNLQENCSKENSLSSTFLNTDWLHTISAYNFESLGSGACLVYRLETRSAPHRTASIPIHGFDTG